MKERKVVFKRYVREQMTLLPPSYEDLVPRNHPVRVAIAHNLKRFSQVAPV